MLPPLLEEYRRDSTHFSLRGSAEMTKPPRDHGEQPFHVQNRPEIHSPVLTGRKRADGLLFAVITFEKTKDYRVNIKENPLSLKNWFEKIIQIVDNTFRMGTRDCPFLISLSPGRRMRRSGPLERATAEESGRLFITRGIISVRRRRPEGGYITSASQWREEKETPEIRREKSGGSENAGRHCLTI